MRNWEQIAKLLYEALIQHRKDMHQTSNRPCATCRQSAEAIKVYEETSKS